MRWLMMAMAVGLAVSVGCKAKPKTTDLAVFKNGTTEQRMALFRTLTTKEDAAMSVIGKGIRDSDPYVRGYCLLLAAYTNPTDLMPDVVELVGKQDELKAATIELFPEMIGGHIGKALAKLPDTGTKGKQVPLWDILALAIDTMTDHDATADTVNEWWEKHRTK